MQISLLFVAFLVYLAKQWALAVPMDTSNALAVTYDIHVDREILWAEYEKEAAKESEVDRGTAFSGMMAKAREIEFVKRNRIISELIGLSNKTKDGIPLNSELPMRAGSSPVSMYGRGIFSDEDLDCQHDICFQKTSHKISFIKHEKRELYYLYPSLDLLLWKPIAASVPDFVCEENEWREWIGKAVKEHEVSISGKAEALSVAQSEYPLPFEIVLESLSKISEFATKPPRDWGKGYVKFEKFSQMFKSVYRAASMNKYCAKEDDNDEAVVVERVSSIAAGPLPDLLFDSFDTAKGSVSSLLRYGNSQTKQDPIPIEQRRRTDNGAFYFDEFTEDDQIDDSRDFSIKKGEKERIPSVSEMVRQGLLNRFISQAGSTVQNQASSFNEFDDLIKATIDSPLTKKDKLSRYIMSHLILGDKNPLTCDQLRQLSKMMLDPAKIGLTSEEGYQNIYNWVLQVYKRLFDATRVSTLDLLAATTHEDVKGYMRNVNSVERIVARLEFMNTEQKDLISLVLSEKEVRDAIRVFGRIKRSYDKTIDGFRRIAC